VEAMIKCLLHSSWLLCGGKCYKNSTHPSIFKFLRYV
jgi:hypothetical protein